MSRKILVLAGAGNVGTPLVKELLRRGAAVRVATRSGRSVGAAEGVVFDYADSQTYAPAFDGVGCAYAMVPMGYPVGEALSSVIRYGINIGVKVVLQTTIEVDLVEHSEYRPIEKLLRESNGEFAILRPGWFADNFHMFWARDIQLGTLALPVGDARTAFTDVRDIAESAAAVLTSNEFDGRTFTVTGPESLSYGEALDIFSSVLGRSIRYVNVTEYEFVQQTVGRGMPKESALYFLSVLNMVKQGGVAAVSDDVRRLTGRPARSLRQYVEDNRSEFTYKTAFRKD